VAKGPDDRVGRLRRRFAGYEVLKLIASGAQGDVYEARDAVLGRLVALKVLRPEVIFDAEREDKSIRRFRREAEAGARLVHPGIVTVYATGEVEGARFIAQELVGDGRTLAHLIDDARNRAQLPGDWYRRVAALFADVAEALAAAHERGIVHRDLKPRNILLAGDDRPKIADFGLARLLGEGELTNTGDLLGTPFYMNPEQVSGRSELVDARSDVFSLGVVFYEALTLTRPFTGDTPQILALIHRADPENPRRVHARVPRDLAVICMKALRKLPEHRFASAGELAADLRRWLAGEAIRSRPPALPVRVAKWLYRRRVAASAVVVLVAAIAGAAYFQVKDVVAEKNAATEQALEIEQRSGEDLVAMLETTYNAADSISVGSEPTRMPRGLLDRVAQRVASIDQPMTRWHLLTLVGRSYANLGLLADADAHLVEALDLARQLFPARDEHTGGTALELGRVRRQLGDLESAEILYREAREVIAALRPEDSPAILAVDFELAQLAEARGDYEGAATRLQAYLATTREQIGRGTDEVQVLVAMQALGRVRLQQDRLADAAEQLEPAYLRGAAILPRIQFLTLTTTLGRLRARQAELAGDAGGNLADEAESLLKTALDGQTRLLGEDDELTATTLTYLGVFYRQRERYDEARPQLEKAAVALAALHGPDFPATLSARNNLAAVDYKLDHVDAAEAAWMEILASDRRHPQSDTGPVKAALHNLWKLTHTAGRHAEALGFAQELVGRTSPSDPKYNSRLKDLAETQQALADVSRKP